MKNILQYCHSCVLPSSRPNLAFGDDGVCSACTQRKEEHQVNWNAREKLFQKLVDGLKKHPNSNHQWDCVIPVSGGKDSTWQVIKCLEYGLQPLCVTWKTSGRNDIGAHNLQSLINLGVDHFDVSINPKVEKAFTLKAFKRLGAAAIPMHMAVFSIPVQVALNFSIPLILWGENSAVQYGTREAKTSGLHMTREWLLKYGVTNGTISNDWFDDELNAKNMAIYYWPKDSELKAKNIQADFLGEYFNWDPVMAYEAAKETGFKAGSKPKTGYYEFADVDDDFIITLHHWMKWYKFGFTRLWDNLSLEVRYNRMTRNDAIALIKEFGEEQPIEEIDKFCQYVNISTKNFHEIADSFRNRDIWCLKNGTWELNHFLIQGWVWQ